MNALGNFCLGVSVMAFVAALLVSRITWPDKGEDCADVDKQGGAR